MVRQRLKSLMPDLDTATLALACKHPSVREAVSDLAVAEVELARCAGASKETKNWEETQAELLDEIRRLTRSLARKT